MKTAATLVMIAKLAVLATFATACGGAQKNKIMADVPVLPYQAPDISEITGIEEPDEADEGDGSAAPEASK